MDSAQLYQAIQDHKAKLHTEDRALGQFFIKVIQQIQELGPDLPKLNEIDPEGAQLAWQLIERLRPEGTGD